MHLIISCMDRRLNRYLQGMASGQTVFVRNAGANVATLKDTLGSLEGVESVTIITHTDCGAMGVVEQVLRGNDRPDDLAEFMRPFIGLRPDRDEIERENGELQADAVRKMMDVEVKSILVNTGTLRYESTGRYRALFMRPSGNTVPKERVDSTYVIQNSPGDRSTDIYIARNFLKIREFDQE
ncbi:carbonic anhydrase [Thermogymnomonas acidicola]|nr:carbonic anhydrase [Thermogymnomonas acidicola]